MLTRIAHAAKRFWGYSEELIALWRADLTVTADFVANNLVYCATLGETIIGFCAVSGKGAIRELEHMWVLPEHMRTGMGTKLLRSALDVIRAEGAATLRIASDPNAEAFYLRLGARRVGTVPSTPVGRTLPLLELSLR